MLEIHRAERADVLADALAELLADRSTRPVRGRGRRGAHARNRALADPDACPARLGARPGERDGVCANVEFPSPGSLVAETLALASGIAPERDPWQPARLVWPLIDVVERGARRALAASRSPATCATATRAPLRAARARRAPVRRVRRAPPGADPGLGPRRVRWHRRARRRRLAAGALAAAARGRRRPEPGRAARAGVRAAARRSRTSWRCRSGFALFGLTRLPASHLQVLQALAARRDVHLMLLHPSPVMWDRGEAQNRLLASWGRDVLGLQTARGRRRHRPPPSPPGARAPRHTPRGAAGRHPRRPTARRGRRCAPATPTRGSTSRRRTAASASTPATAAPARSRCCARRSCTGSPTTRRSSRAT